MAVEYSVEVCKKLEEKFRSAKLHRPMRIQRYEPGTSLVYDVSSVEQANKGRVHLVVEKFVGGGFAGQVYRVKVEKVEADNGRIANIEAGGTYAIKILIPPSGKAKLFRNFLYWVGFQGPFQLQVNPAAARAGALWQKFIRRAAKIRFGDENAVVNIHATFVDKNLGSCGELSEWIEGRTWLLEVDDHMDALKRRQKGLPVNEQYLGSPEYRQKHKFMKDFVNLLHDVGAHEFARQYEWSTCKSQPNCLKRENAGLTAVDFRAGLALLPFLPMSPGDFKLIAKGLARGSLVQFDRGNIKKLQQFVEANKEDFSDIAPMLDELKKAEIVYRNSTPDITHNHIRLLYSRKLWSTMLSIAVTGWKVRNLLDKKSEQKLRVGKIKTLLFFLIGIIPFFGGIIRKIWARPDWRKHYIFLLTSWNYFGHAVKAKMAEKTIVWHRAGRISAEKSLKIANSFGLFLCHLPFSIIFVCLHRLFTDAQYAKEKIIYIFVRPVRLYFSAKLREQWLRDMVLEGQKKHMLSENDAEVILSKIKEPFIQKYLVSLVVHFLTLPVTQIVSVIVSWLFWITHPEVSPEARAAGVAAILILFQITPVSPGSLVRGFYVLYLVIRERNFKDYNIAVFLGFFKYIGYLAFPIQMTYRYPALSRFMASHWATEAVHFVPVFGERGALLEHWVFCLFYNWPLTIRRRMRKRAEIRAALKPRYWHIVPAAIAGAIILWTGSAAYTETPRLLDIWYLVVIVPILCGTVVTLACGGAKLWKRIIAAVVCGMLIGLLYSGATPLIDLNSGITAGYILKTLVWSTFIFAIFSPIGAIITELKLFDPDLN